MNLTVFKMNHPNVSAASHLTESLEVHMLSRLSDLELSAPKEMIEIYRRLANDLEQVGRDGPESIAPEVSISDWMIAKRAVPILLGTVLGHPTVTDGKPAATTEIIFWDEHWQLARTLNRWYRLGRPLVGGSNQ